MQKPTPQSLYHRLGMLRNELPKAEDLHKPALSRWRAQVLAIAEAANAVHESFALRDNFGAMRQFGDVDEMHAVVAQSIDNILARLELLLPVDAQGIFIPAGGVFDGYQAVSKAIELTKGRLLLVDPYADDKLISDFLPLAPERVFVSVLSDAGLAKPSLRPAVGRWKEQWNDRRPLEVRLASARSLHDRLIIVDGETAWVLGQSFKDLAKRAHSSLIRMDSESAKLKIEAHMNIWQAAEGLE